MPDHCIATNNKQKMHYNALLIVNIINRILQQNKNTFALKKKKELMVPLKYKYWDVIYPLSRGCLQIIRGAFNSFLQKRMVMIGVRVFKSTTTKIAQDWSVNCSIFYTFLKKASGMKGADFWMACCRNFM